MVLGLGVRENHLGVCYDAGYWALPLRLLIQQIGGQSLTVCMANAPADAKAAGQEHTLRHTGVAVHVCRERGMFLFCVLKIFQ